MTTTLDRRTPHDHHAEQSVLGAILLAPTTITDVANTLIDADFYHPAHQLIYQAIIELWSRNSDIDIVLTAGQLDRHDNLDRIGGPMYLHDLIATVPTAINAPHYAQIVAEQAVLRRLAAAGETVANMGYQGLADTDLDVLIDQAQQAVSGVTRDKAESDYHTLSSALHDTMNELDAIADAGGLAQGVPTGFIDLDAITNGLHGGQMIIIAARPGVGKSTIGLDIMRSCSITNGKTSAIFSLEMSKVEIVTRLLSAETDIRMADMRAGRMTAEQWGILGKRAAEIDSAPIIIDDSPSLTMMDIRAKARKIKQERGLDLVVIDYLQLMSSGKKVESRQQEVSEFSRQIKLLAKELDVPVIAISQLNRGPESRDNKRPQLSDLRESGSLEQDADMVILMNRPDSQDKDHEKAGEAELIVAKHRGGPIDTIVVAHQLHYSKFVNMSRG